tara:strand:+ start:1125 stop:1988 length:864 start_codon:yes stop_codon:yes gene_type:complete
MNWSLRKEKEMKDTQRSKCYRWENKLRGANMVENVVIYLVRYLDWKVRNMPAKNRGAGYNRKFVASNGTERYFQNRVCFIKKGRSAHSWSQGMIDGKAIVNMMLPTSWALQYAVVLHEFAHSIEPYDSHGPNWMSTFCILLNRFHPDHPSLESLARSLDASGIKYVPFKDNPWYRGFCRVKFNADKAPAFTKLIAKAWADGKEIYGKKHNATNWKLRVMNLIKRHNLDVVDQVGFHNRWNDGMLEGQFGVYFENGESVYFYADGEETPDEKQAFWKDVYEELNINYK